MTSVDQRSQVLKHLKKGGTLTQLQALHRFGCLRLAARIKELRDAGHMIHTTIISTKYGARIAEYRLIGNLHCPRNTKTDKR